jgi:hypothetical protein
VNVLGCVGFRSPTHRFDIDDLGMRRGDQKGG